MKLLLFLACAVAATADPMPPYNLKCEHNAVGLSEEKLKELSKQQLFATDNPTPLISWTVAHCERSARQTAFRVLVSDDSSMTSTIWDTGKVLGEIDHMRYAGPGLHSGKTYFWKVTWWDHKDRATESEEIGHFLTGVLDSNDWSAAKWIAADTSITTAPLLSKSATVSGSVDKATLFISGLGFCKPYINGVDLNARYNPSIALTPGWTNYEKHTPYVVYDVSEEVKRKTNMEMEVLLGLGWRNTKDFPLKDPNGLPKSDSVERVLRLILNITDTQGKVQTIVSDSSWSSTQSAITSDSVYNGESYNNNNMNKKVVGTKEVTGPSGDMYLQTIPPMSEVGTELPINLYTPAGKDKNTIIVDFQNNSAGVCWINTRGVLSFTIKHAEVPMHPPYGTMDGSLYYANLRSAKATDIFSSDDTVMSYQPTFTYHGFRYAEVTGYNSTLTKNDIKKIVIHSDVKMNGQLNTSNPLLNNIQENCVRGQLSNLMSVMTDCNQRDERLGWMGDSGLSAKSMQLNFDMNSFHSNFLQLIVDEQIDSNIPDVVPFYRYGGRPADPSWSQAFPEILFQNAQHSTNHDVATKFYPALMQYVQSMIKMIPSSGIGSMFARYGDWVPPPEHPKVDSHFVSAFSTLLSISEAQQLATLLGHSDDAKSLGDTLKQQAESFNKAFMNSNTSQYLNGIQASYVLPLAIHVVPENSVDQVVKNFLNQLTGPDKTHVTGGITTTRHLLEVLSEHKQHDLALAIVEQVDYPSWGWMIHNKMEPATAVWELWNAWKSGPGMNSRNHHMYSSVSGWLLTDLAGIKTAEGTFGYKEIHFHPARLLGLSQATVSLKYPKPVHISWQRNGGVQCAKSPEDQSSLNPTLPKHDGLSISCGDSDGGVIQKVLFASLGNPTGHCGGYHKLGSCHNTKSKEIIEHLCLGKRSCRVPTDADYWGDPCPNEVKWLSVAVQCGSDYKYSSVRVNVSVPIGSKGSIFLPAHGKHNIKVWDGDLMLYDQDSGLTQTQGILSSKWIPDSGSLKLDLESGLYTFTMKGETPKRGCIDSRVKSNDTILLKCEDTRDVITSIDWASFGKPETAVHGNCYTHSVGECHAGSSQFTIEKECLGRQQCKINVHKSFFGKLHCLETNERGHLIVEFACSSRPYTPL